MCYALTSHRVSLIIEFNLSLTCFHLQLAIEIIMIPVGTALLAKGIASFLTFHTRTDKLFDLFLKSSTNYLTKVECGLSGRYEYSSVFQDCVFVLTNIPD